MRKFGLAIVAACVGMMWSAAAWAVTDGSVTGQDEGGTPVANTVVHMNVVPNAEANTPPARQHPVQYPMARSTATGTVPVAYNEKTIDDRTKYTAVYWYMKNGVTYVAQRPLTEVGNGAPVRFKPVTPTSTAGGPSPMPPGFRYVNPTEPFSGFGVTGFISGNYNDQMIREYLTLTGIQTNALADTGSGVGGGVTLFYNIPLAGPITVGPFFTANFMDLSTGRTFPGGFKLYMRDKDQFTFGPMFGVPLRTNDNTDVLIFVQLGASVAERQLIIGLPASADTQWVWGGTIGAGGMVHRPNWMLGNLPVAAFAQVSLTDWSTPRYVGPGGSPFFTYRPEMLSVSAMAGVTVMLQNLMPR